MPFTEKLPRWDAAGTEPPDNKKVAGWLPDDHPPADYFNWLQHQTYTVTKELQEKAAEKAMLDSHAATTTGVHGAVSSATPSAIIQRDSFGRAKIAVPAAADDIARKDTVDGAVQPIAAELSDAAATALALTPAQVTDFYNPRPSALRVKSINGRTLINLQGRYGGFESNTNGWSLNSPNLGALESSSDTATTGIRSAKVTIAAGKTSANMSAANGLRQGVQGRYHVLIADVKCGTCTNIRIRADTGSANGNSVSSTASFQPTFFRWDTTSYATTMFPSFDINGAAGTYGYIDSVRVYEITLADYNLLSTMTPAQAAAKYPYVDDLKNVNGVYIRNMTILGDLDKDQYVFYPDCQLASSMDGSNYDELYTDADGRARVTRRFRTMELTGEMAWEYGDTKASSKQVRLPVSGQLVDSERVVKYDGKIVSHVYPYSAGDQSFMTQGTDSKLYLTIPSTDSGWGNSYTPTADEIKAYFNGWRIYTDGQPVINGYNGTGAKRWARRWNGVSQAGDGDFGDSTLTLPTSLAPNFSPYRLQYQLAAQIDEPVRSEGAILLTKGANTLEVGSGAVVREKVNVSDGSGLPRINYDGASKLQYRTNKDVEIYCNGKFDRLWRKYYNSSLGYGLFVADIDSNVWDKSAVYEVTYLALDVHQVGIPPAQVNAEYASNMRTVADDASKAATQLARRVSVLENGSAQVKQPQWVSATLLNGWGSTIPISYMLDSMGFVHLRGRMTGGAIATGTAIFLLPKGYRPGETVTPVTASSNGSVYSPAILNITTDGRILIDTATGANRLSMDGITFRAEQ